MAARRTSTARRRGTISVPRLSPNAPPWDRYVAGVLRGRIKIGQLVRFACERHVRDLQNRKRSGFYFDQDAAVHAVEFFSFLKHSKGEWAGQTIELEPWQQFVVASAFGWKRADGTRRFRIVYEEVPRKNGKSTKLAGVGLYLLVADEEPGAEVYTAATKRDQARIVHSEAVRMVRASSDLSARVQRFRDNLSIADTASKYEPLGADADTTDGLNVHGALIDELHAHRSRDMWDVLETATGSRRQPLLYAITTAGLERDSICGEIHDHAVQVLEGTVQDEALFAYIATIDRDDDWTDPKVWAKANPNLGVSVKLESLEEECERAKAIPSSQNVFRRFRLNQWVSPLSRWIRRDQWDACAGDLPFRELEESLEGRRCFGGLDLASSVDLAALALAFPPLERGGPIACLSYFWAPRDVVLEEEKIRRDRVPYDAWVRDGWLTATPGNVIDYGFIRSDVDELAERFDLVQLGYDPWNATQFASEMEEAGYQMVPIRQGVISLNEPTKELSKRVVSSGLIHGGHPILRWNADNLIVRQDSAGNVKPDREKSRQKIDGVVALIMAIDRAIRNEEGGPKPSVYETRGLRTV